jgi:hypothetical protein
MSDAQTWTVIGGFLAILVTMSGLVLRIVRLEISGLRNEMVARFDALDRDVQRLFERVFHEGTEG